MKDKILQFWLDNSAQQALEYSNKVLTYTELSQRVNEKIALLRSLGLKEKDHVALRVKDSLIYLELFLALWKLDATLIPVDSQVNTKNMVEILEEADVEFLLTESKVKNNSAFYSSLPMEPVYECTDFDVLRILPAKAKIPQIEDSSSPDTGYMILYTSGTSGKGKGVVIRKEAFISNVQKVINYTNLTAEDSIFLTLPLTYCFALSQLFAHLIVGGEVVLYNNINLSTEVLLKIKEHQVTNYAATPYFYENLVKDVTSKNESLLHNQIRFFMSAGGYLSKYVIKDILQLFPHVAFYNNYGQTEASPRLTYNRITGLDCDIESVGCPLPGIEIKIFGDDGTPLGKNAVGEIGYLSEDRMVGYYKHKSIDGNEFYMSGDLGYINDNNNIVIVGRKDSMIKVNGRKVYKNIIEDQLNQLPFVKNLKVKKERHDTLGEYFVAYVVLKEKCDEEEAKKSINDFCKKNFNKYAIPRKIVFCNHMTLSLNQKVIL